MNVFDKAVNMHLKLIKNDMINMTVLTVIAGIITCIPSLFSIFMPVVFLLGITIFSYRVYYKVIYKTVQGEDAVFYTMMPLSSGQQILSRVTALGIFQLIAVLLSLGYGFAVMNLSVLKGLTTGFLDAFEFIGEEAGIPVIVTGFLDIWASVFACMMILLCFSFRYRRRKDEGKSGKVIFAGIAGLFILDSLKSELLVLVDSSLWIFLVIAELLIDVVLIAVFYRAAVRTIE